MSLLKRAFRGSGSKENVVEHVTQDAHKKRKCKNEYKPQEIDPSSFTMYPMQEVVFVKKYSQSPVDMLAARIANRIMKEGLCKISKSDMAGEIEKYVIEVVIAKQK